MKRLKRLKRLRNLRSIRDSILASDNCSRARFLLREMPYVQSININWNWGSFGDVTMFDGTEINVYQDEHFHEIEVIHTLALKTYFWIIGGNYKDIEVFD